MRKEFPERVITSFLHNYKAVDIMRECQISKNKFYALRNDPDFQKILTDRRSEMVKEAVSKMEGYLCENVETLQEIIRNPEVKDQTRVNAIQIFMNQLAQWKQTSELIARIEHLEETTKTVDNENW